MPPGFIILQRKIFDWYGYQNPKRLQLWITLLLLATFKDHRIVWNGKPIDLHRGELITGRRKLVGYCKMSESYVEKLLLEFEIEGQIRQQKTNTSRLITILKYNDYQNSNNNEDNGEDNGEDNKKTTERHNRTMYNKENKENNISIPPALEEVLAYKLEINGNIEPSRFIDFYESNGWMVGKNKMKSWKAAYRRACSEWDKEKKFIKFEGI